MSNNLKNLSIEELIKIKKENKKKLKKEYLEHKKQKLIEEINKIQKAREKIKINNKPNPKPNPKPKIKPTEEKTFEEYFKDCIKNKTIPPDTPSYLRKALERALKEYDQGIEKEKSSLDEFANKYIVKGKTAVTPMEFF